MTAPVDPKEPKPKSEFVGGLRNGVILGAVILAIAIPWMRSRQAQAPAPAVPPAVTSQAPAQRPAPARPAIPEAPGVLPTFTADVVSADVRHVANWSFYTGDHQGKSVVILDKKNARVHVFDPQGRQTASTPALLGEAIGDDSAPGIGDKPLAQIKPEEKTTPAGRFQAEPGMNNHGEDIIWVDYDAAVSMHRVRPLVAAERRLERLASATSDDNRISFGCINLPVKFYEGVLSPTVKQTGAIVYVLPETRPAQDVFASWDVTDAAQNQARWPQFAAARMAKAAPAGHGTVALHEAKANRDAVQQ